MKARWCILLTVIWCCAACGAPSLRHKRDVNRLLAQSDYPAAQAKIERGKNKTYKRRDALLYYLDMGAVQHDAHAHAMSDENLAQAQQHIDELFTQSLSAHAGRYLINDLTVPYYPAPYEQALTYYYRAMNFLNLGDVNGALVEANKAVFFLDGLRGEKKKGYRDDPFVQYFASLVFESAGKRDDARIARTRAREAYAAARDAGALADPSAFPAAPPPAGWGEVILVHANGTAPLKKSQTFQVAWGDVLFWTQSPQEGEDVSPQLQNALTAGLLGNSVTLAYPVLEQTPFEIKASEVLTPQGAVYSTKLMSDLAARAQDNLKENETAVMTRMALRAAAKRTAAVQAKHAAQQASNDENVGELTGMFVSMLGALTEKADTRQWFTLPAQLRMARFYLPAGEQSFTLRFKDGFGNIVGEHTFEKVPVEDGGRVYLHYRTAR